MDISGVKGKMRKRTFVWMSMTVFFLSLSAVALGSHRMNADNIIFLADQLNAGYLLNGCNSSVRDLFLNISSQPVSLPKDKTGLLKRLPEEIWKDPVMQLLYLGIIFGLTILFVRYRTRSLRQTNQILREKEKIAEEVRIQRDQLSLAHKNVTDSIRYAQKIQQALLPSDYYFRCLLPASFILYLPKDIVSGDFYWITQREKKVYFTVADCTGHGVPGAFMSMIGFEILDKIINDQKIENPAEILNILNQGITNTFSRGEENILLKDGMDLSFCTLDRQRQQLEFAGAFHTLYLIRDNNLIEFKGDRVSVGLGEQEEQHFTNHTIPLREGDKVYLFSDGYADQFGGPNEKKFMYRRFRHLLLSIHHLPLDKQRTIIYDTHLSWKGDNEQVDDMLVIGIEPLIDVGNLTK